jgi:TetR/AcrR family transcriptional regulator, transcriptional repressor for nem operon
MAQGSKLADTPHRRAAVLDSAERLVQARGFNGFSYADIASELGITKAALHYHFAGKAELGEAVIARYTERFASSLAAIDATPGSALDRLDAYADLYLEVLRGDGLCLCGMLAADYETLPDPMRVAVVSFFDLNLRWLVRLLKEGKADGSLRFPGRAPDTAQMIIGTLEGAMLVARPYGDTRRFRAAVAQLLAGLRADPSRHRARP